MELILLELVGQIHLSHYCDDAEGELGHLKLGKDEREEG